MSYHPSHRKPPRQERWPDATPDQAWPAYVGADGYRDAQAWGATGTLTGNGYDARGVITTPAVITAAAGMAEPGRGTDTAPRRTATLPPTTTTGAPADTRA